MKFNTPYDREHTPEAPNSGEIITEQQGYISAQDQIEALIYAGQRLDESRAGYEFDPDQEVPDDYFDPTSMRNLDMVEAQQFLDAKRDSLMEAQKMAEKKAADAATKKPPVASPSVGDTKPNNVEIPSDLA